MTRKIDAEIAVPAQCELAGRGLLRWVDILGGQVHALDPVSGAHSSFGTGQPVGAVGLSRDGGLILALAAQPHAGDIFACTPGVTGRPPYLFDG